jgi:hypothetical protein
VYGHCPRGPLTGTASGGPGLNSGALHLRTSPVSFSSGSSDCCFHSQSLLLSDHISPKLPCQCTMDQTTRFGDLARDGRRYESELINPRQLRNRNRPDHKQSVEDKPNQMRILLCPNPATTPSCQHIEAKLLQRHPRTYTAFFEASPERTHSSILGLGRRLEQQPCWTWQEKSF